MPWYKYREKMTHGSWEYIHLNCSLNEVEEYVREYLMAWQDEWRGAEIKHVPVPPKHVLFNHINIARNKLESAQENLKELLKQSTKYYKHIPAGDEAQKVYDDFIKEKHRKQRLAHEKRMKKAREKNNEISISNVMTWMRNEARFDVNEVQLVKKELMELSKMDRLEGFYHLWLNVCQKKFRPRYAQNVDITGDKNEINSWAAFYLGMTTEPPAGKSLEGLKQNVDFTQVLGIKRIEVVAR